MKIAIVLPRFPYPLEKGDKLRAYHQIVALSRMGHSLCLFCLSHERVSEAQMAALRPHCETIQVARLGRVASLLRAAASMLACRSVQVGYWRSRRARSMYARFETATRPDVVYSQMVRTITMVAGSKLPKAMDYQDALSKNMERRMAATPRGPRRFLYHFEFKMLRNCEYKAFDIFDALAIISEPDSKAIPRQYGRPIAVIPNGVDFSYFKPQEKREGCDVLFCGNMQYQPNVLAAQCLAREVMPIVWQSMPHATLRLAGATPTLAVRCLAGSRVEVTGTVPDMRPHYASAKVFAAPMQTGSGLQNKLLEAMAMEVPCVTSTIANAALGAMPGQEVLIGDNPQEMAQHIVQLLGSQQQRDIQADNARRFVHSRYSWERCGQQLAELLEEAVRQHNRQHA